MVPSVFDPRLETIAAHLGPSDAVLQKASEFTHPETGRRVIVWEALHYDPAQQVVEVENCFEEVDAGGQVVARTTAPYALRWVYRDEMQYLLELSGFALEALYGDFVRGPFRYGGEQVWVARKV